MNVFVAIDKHGTHTGRLSFGLDCPVKALRFPVHQDSLREGKFSNFYAERYLKNSLNLKYFQIFKEKYTICFTKLNDFQIKFAISNYS